MTEKDDPSWVAFGESGQVGRDSRQPSTTGNGVDRNGTLAEAGPHCSDPAGFSALECCVLDHLDRGVIALDSAGNVLLANRPARYILDAGHSLRLHDGRLEFLDEAVDVQLTRLLAALPLTSTDTHGFVARLKPTSGEDAFRVLVAPLSGATRSEIAVLVYIFDTKRERVISHQVLRDLYGLTAAQAAVAAFLFEGDSVDETSERLGLSVNTVRSHLKHIFAKCEVRSQVELMRLLNLGPHHV